MFGGGMLTGEKIRNEVKRGNIKISHYDPECINPNSYNLKLHPQLLIYKRDAVRANIIEGAMPKPIQAGIDRPNELEKIESKVVNRLTKQGEHGSSKRHKKKKKSVEVFHKNVYAENCTSDVAFGSACVIEKFDCANRFDDLSETVIASKSSVDAIDKSIDDLRKMIKRSMVDIVDAASYDTEVLYNNELQIEKNINKLGLYPNIESAVLPPLDMHKENETIEFEIPEEGFVLQPGVLYIGRTVERTCTDKYIPMINGRSSGGRLGISIHICAGFGDIGFDGTWTLEITCVEPVRIYPNSEIAQVCFFKPYGKVKDLYRGRYYQQEDATASRFSREKGDNHNE